MKSVLSTCSKMREGVREAGSRTVSRKEMMLGPPARQRRMATSRRIFFFFTGFRILMTHLEPVGVWQPSKTSEYLPRPTLRTTS